MTRCDSNANAVSNWTADDKLSCRLLILRKTHLQIPVQLISGCSGNKINHTAVCITTIERPLRASKDLDASQMVGIWGFDGADSPVVLSALTADGAILDAGITGLADFSVTDSSRNLDGAVLSGLIALDARVSGSRHLLGRLVLLTDGEDLADVVSAEDAEAAVAKSLRGRSERTAKVEAETPAEAKDGQVETKDTQVDTLAATEVAAEAPTAAAAEAKARDKSIN